MINLTTYSEGGSIKDNMHTMTVDAGGKTYNVCLAMTEEERQEGLQNVTDLPNNEGMLFVFEEPQHVEFWMKDTLIPLDLVYMDEDGEVLNVYHGEPLDETMLEGEDIQFVLEVNAGSGIKVGDEIDLSDILEEVDLLDDTDEEEDDDFVMHVLDENGDSQMQLQGGERIFSRPNTVTLVRMAKRAYNSRSEKDYKALGNKLFKYLKTQDTKEEDYVEIPDKK